MSSNLIQNYISKPRQPQTPAKPKPDFDIKKELDNRTFIKPLPGKGKLLSGNILYAPIDTFNDMTYAFKALGHAAKGKANDHELGKLNDLGMLTGGLAIAGYLFTKKTTPMTKGMEFVGLASFFASMALWPKIAIQLPAYLIHGVNVQKQYQDSFGRTKPFYQDPQFIPWDLYSDDEISKIGDKLGVPKNIPNRRDFIQEKMRKLAVQNNTLWMLTAGFATPIMSALICNQAEPFLLKYQNNQKNKKADKILTNLEGYSQKYQTHPAEKNVAEIIKKHANQPITEELFEEIAGALTRDMDPVTSESFIKDLHSQLVTKKEGIGYSISDNTAKNITANLRKVFEDKGCDKEFINAVVPDETDMVQLFRDKGFSGKSFKETEHTGISNTIVDEIIKRAEVFNPAHPDIAEDLGDIREFINASTKEKHPIIKALREVRASLLDDTAQGTLRKLAGILDNFRAKNLALDEYAYIKVASAPETVIANYWNNTAQKVMKSLGFTASEIEKVRFNRTLMGGLLREKLEHIASDKTSYDRVMKTLVEQISTLNEQIRPCDLTCHMLDNTSNKTGYEKQVENLFHKFAEALRKMDFSRTASAVAGDWGNENGTYIRIQKLFAEDRLLGVKSSFHRLICTFDLYRRVATDPNSLTHIDPNKNNLLYREIKEELIELCKIIMLEGHSSDHATKFWMLRNPNPSTDDMSPLEVADGKIKNKYFGKAAGTTDISTDKYFYQNAMKFMFNDKIHPDTEAILERNISLKDEFSNYRKLVYEKLGGDKYFAKPRHLVSPNGSKNQHSDIKFMLTGIAPDEFFFKAGQQAFNTKKWLKMFGGFGAGLLGVTVLTQFFLGRLKAPKAGKK